MSVPLQNPSSRIQSIDVVRGIIMVVMALDHTRDFFHDQAFLFKPTDLAKTTTILFFTRWITHFCAPGFTLLAGISVYLQKSTRNTASLSLFLLTRGLWLILLEFMVIRFALMFNFYFDATVLTVFWVIGAGMVIMAGAVYLSDLAVLIIGFLLVITHSGLALIDAPEGLAGAWAFLMKGGIVMIDDRLLVVSYPVLPWAGMIMIGYFTGRLYCQSVEAKVRQRRLLLYGTLAIATFVVLRIANVYDDQWVTGDLNTTIMSFLNISKYPPSLQFCLLTGGVIMIGLSLAERMKPKFTAFFNVYGKVPLFYFIAHLFIIHLGALILYLIESGKSVSEIDFHFTKSIGGLSAGSGVSLTWVYLIWMAVVAILYPLCKWYGAFKKENKAWWTSYL